MRVGAKQKTECSRQRAVERLRPRRVIQGARDYAVHALVSREGDGLIVWQRAERRGRAAHRLRLTATRSGAVAIGKATTVGGRVAGRRTTGLLCVLSVAMRTVGRFIPLGSASHLAGNFTDWLRRYFGCGCLLGSHHMSKSRARHSGNYEHERKQYMQPYFAHTLSISIFPTNPKPAAMLRDILKLQALQ